MINAVLDRLLEENVPFDLSKRQIRIWLGGFSEGTYDRAARIGDGFLSKRNL